MVPAKDSLITSNRNQLTYLCREEKSLERHGGDHSIKETLKEASLHIGLRKPQGFSRTESPGSPLEWVTLVFLQFLHISTQESKPQGPTGKRKVLVEALSFLPVIPSI